eukprot:GHVU01219639.1.p1 GENE.GHVU01219639.1~~GHVU01219639.1.p1  ORF type:complete len:192 (-),score=18.13 GHVU01219639.1:343-891(-)
MGNRVGIDVSGTVLRIACSVPTPGPEEDEASGGGKTERGSDEYREHCHLEDFLRRAPIAKQNYSITARFRKRRENTETGHDGGASSPVSVSVGGAYSSTGTATGAQLPAECESHRSDLLRNAEPQLPTDADRSSSAVEDTPVAVPSSSEGASGDILSYRKVSCFVVAYENLDEVIDLDRQEN